MLKSGEKAQRKEPDSSTKIKGTVKNVPKYKSVSPAKKSDNMSASNGFKKPQPPPNTNIDNSRVTPVGNNEKEQQEDSESGLEPEKVIDIIKEQFFKEMQRVEVRNKPIFYKIERD